MAATHCVTMLLEQGDHVVAGTDIYGGTYRLLHKIVNRAGIGVSLVPTTDLAAVAAAITPAHEAGLGRKPGQSADVDHRHRGLRKLAHGTAALLGVDNTLATPVLTRPLELGADIVMHSATKYLGGHSDVLGGALVVSDPELLERLYFIQNATGAVMGPLEAFLCSRGLKTLELRVREQSRTARGSPSSWPPTAACAACSIRALPSHPGHDDRGAADAGRLRRHAQLRGGRRFRGRETSGRIARGCSSWPSAWARSNR